ncbi:MAG: N-acetyltransferase [Thermodesulfobacteriota bacterium]
MVRKAKLEDVKAVYELVEAFARKGEMLHRSIVEVYENIRDFFVYEEDGSVVGACALHICWEEMGEVRSLVVGKEAGGKGIGRALVTACLDEARTLGLKKIFALTYAPAFFEKLKFRSIDKDVLPQKIWGDCVKCVKFPNCDENAVIIEL